MFRSCRKYWTVRALSVFLYSSQNAQFFKYLLIRFFFYRYEPFEFGAATLKVNKDTTKKLLGKINFAPCGVAFVKPEVRTGILPRMLEEILNTRLMVKQSMKIHGNENQVLQRVLHSQQLGLKLIANVTYGYTAANFSGRMPCMEVRCICIIRLFDRLTEN